jgi:hypothetical protein
LLEKIKIEKALFSLNAALEKIEKGDKRAAIGDLNFAKENIHEVKWILEDQLENKS